MMALRRGHRDEVWEEPLQARPRWDRSLLQAAAARWEQTRRTWVAQGVAAVVAPSPGPRFVLSGYQASFDELEAILFHPDVIRAIEAPPTAPLTERSAPPSRLPTGAARYGWPRRHRPVKIYDLVPLGLELDLLELRLVELDDLVDVFIVVEAARSYGGLRKPLFLDRNLNRFARFRDKLIHIVLDENLLAAAYPNRQRGEQRGGIDWRGEDAFRAAMWQTFRQRVQLPANAILLSSDVDEFPPRNVLFWLRNFEVALPLRLRLPTLRYHFGWRDAEEFAEMVVLSAAEFPAIDSPAPHRLRHWPGRTLGVRGGVHLTSFLPPLALIAKFAMTTDWAPGIVPYLRNHNGETDAMVSEGRWFDRWLSPYDAAVDPAALIPWAAQANRHRYSHFFGDAPPSAPDDA